MHDRADRHSGDCLRTSPPLRLSTDQRGVAAARDDGESQAGVANDARRQPIGDSAAKLRAHNRFRSRAGDLSEPGQSRESVGFESALDCGYDLCSPEAEFVYLAVVLDAFSRKVVGWSLDRTLQPVADPCARTGDRAIDSRRRVWCIIPTEACSTLAEITSRSCESTR